MAQHTGRLYDDDLTVGADEYSESFSTEFVDLFEPLGDDDAPIAKLKTIILSIDWEITDDILHQLNDELQDLKDVWAGNKINLVYIQALEKIGKYICAEKANAHPNAIKLLLAFYYDLEKIVSSVSMSEETKKQLLLQDVKKFEQFKLQIVPSAPQEKKSVPVAPIPETKNVLTPLKAIVLGIDWEISDKELVHLGEEVARLEKEFAESRAKLIFLQGIGALGSYIRSTKDKVHPDAFKLLHSFIEGMEKICVEDLSSAKEKEILLAEVSKFNAFKAVIAVVASEVVVSAEDSIPSASGREVHVDEEEEEYEEGGVITPAFADMPEDVHGFDVDAEVVKSDIDQRVASFFGEDELAAEPVAAVLAVPPEKLQEGGEVASRLDDLFGDDRAVEQFGQRAVASDIALEGVDVETEADDDSGEKALLFEGGKLAPALAEAGGESAGGDQFLGEAATVADSSVAAPVIPGVDVETEADDESGEAPLPREQGWVAPALMFSDEGYGFRETELTADVDEDDFDLEDRLDSFFGAEIEESSQGVPAQIDDGEDTLPPALTAAEGLQPAAIEQPGASTFLATVEPLGLETQDRVDAGLLAEVQEITPRVADFIVEETTGSQVSVDALNGERGVVFEPVGDDVEVDELPVFPGIMGADGLSVVEQEFLARLRECLASMLEKKYYTELPSFLDEANTLIQIWQTQYVKMSFLQLLVTVCQYIDRVGADFETLALLQSLGESLELVFQGKKATGEGQEKILFAEMGRVLCWQQGLILSVLAQKGSTKTDDAEVQVMNDLTDFFGDK